MPFENVRLTSEQREKIAAMKIKNTYGSYCDITKGIDPIEITIDKSTGNWLAWCYTHHDIAEHVSEFTFMYGNVPVPVQAVNNGAAWKITRIDADEETLSDSRFHATLTEAFKAYAER